MSVPDSNGSPGPSEEPLLDINGNPIPTNWSPGSVPASTDTPAPTAAKPASAGGRAPGGANRAPSNASKAPPPPRPAASLSPGQSALSGEVRYDLAGNPLPAVTSILPPTPPAYTSSASSRAGRGPQTSKSSGGNPLGMVIALILVALILGAGYVMYQKYQTNQKTLANPPAASAPASGSGSSAKPAAKPHASPSGSKH